MNSQTEKAQAAARATAGLSDEHQRILRVVAAVRAECGRVEKGSAPDQEFFRKALDFIKNYADKFHHAKEEDILFPELGKPEVQMHCDPRQVMLLEHEQGRSFARCLEAALKDGRPAELTESARGYCDVLEEHIYKEDNILYPMAEEALGPERRADIKERFAAVDKKFAAAVAPLVAFADGLSGLQAAA